MPSKLTYLITNNHPKDFSVLPPFKITQTERQLIIIESYQQYYYMVIGVGIVSTSIFIAWAILTHAFLYLLILAPVFLYAKYNWKTFSLIKHKNRKYIFDHASQTLSLPSGANVVFADVVSIKVSPRRNNFTSEGNFQYYETRITLVNENEIAFECNKKRHCESLVQMISKFVNAKQLL